MITKAYVNKVKGLGNYTKGYNFKIHVEGNSYPNLVSALYKTRQEANLALHHYLDYGKLDTYGTAERTSHE